MYIYIYVYIYIDLEANSRQNMWRYVKGRCNQVGVSENVVYPIVPNGFADHYPVFKWLFHWEYTQHFQTNPGKGATFETGHHGISGPIALLERNLLGFRSAEVGPSEP